MSDVAIGLINRSQKPNTLFPGSLIQVAQTLESLTTTSTINQTVGLLNPECKRKFLGSG